MNILESEKEERTRACDSLSDLIYEDFEWIEENPNKNKIFRYKLFLDFLTWAITIGYLGKSGLLRNKELIEGLHDISVPTLLKKVAYAEDNTDTDIATMEKVNKLVDSVYSISDTTRKNKGKSYNTSRKRADDIARNETNIAFNCKKHDEEKKGAKYHIWVSQRDKRVRESHGDCEGQKKPIDEPFEVNGYLMMYPMDDTYGAPVDEIVGCRCSEEFEY